MSRVAAGHAARLVAATLVVATLIVATWGVAAPARAENAVAAASSKRRTPIVTASTRPVRIQVVMVGRGPVRAEMERAVRELVGALPELSWSEGEAVPSDAMTQVLIDVTDRTRVRVVASPARGSTPGAPATRPPIVREIITDRLSAEVARETVAQIVQTTVRALLDPASEPDAGTPAAMLEPPPIAPLPLLSAPPVPVAAGGATSARRVETVTRAPLVSAAPQRAHAYSAVLSVGQHSFPYYLGEPLLSVQAKVNSVALSLERRHGVWTTTARLSGDWSRGTVVAVTTATQVLTSSAGISASMDASPLSFALGLDAGVAVIHQETSAEQWVDPGAWLALGLPGVLGSGWSAGPMVGLRSSVSVDLFSRAFARLESALPVTWLNTRDVNGDSAWRVARYAQVLLSVGYRL